MCSSDLAGNLDTGGRGTHGKGRGPKLAERGEHEVGVSMGNGAGDTDGSLSKEQIIFSERDPSSELRKRMISSPTTLSAILARKSPRIKQQLIDSRSFRRNFRSWALRFRL